MTNREAAQALFVTEKTIERISGPRTASSISTSRTELSAALAHAQPFSAAESAPELVRQ
jgi:hypothetical protein